VCELTELAGGEWSFVAVFKHIAANLTVEMNTRE